MIFLKTYPGLLRREFGMIGAPLAPRGDTLLIIYFCEGNRRDLSGFFARCRMGGTRV